MMQNDLSPIAEVESPHNRRAVGMSDASSITIGPSPEQLQLFELYKKKDNDPFLFNRLRQGVNESL